MQKLLKNNKGFTLVEVIVVAVIVLVLAAVAIPLYTQYVADSRKAAAENIAGSIATAAGAALQQGGTITSRTVNAASTQRTVTFTPGAGGVGSSITVQIPPNYDVTLATNSVIVCHSASTALSAEMKFGN